MRRVLRFFELSLLTTTHAYSLTVGIVCLFYSWCLWSLFRRFSKVEVDPWRASSFLKSHFCHFPQAAFLFPPSAFTAEIGSTSSWRVWIFLKGLLAFSFRFTQLRRVSPLTMWQAEGFQLTIILLTLKFLTPHWTLYFWQQFDLHLASLHLTKREVISCVCFLHQ